MSAAENFRRPPTPATSRHQPSFAEGRIFKARFKPFEVLVVLCLSRASVKLPIPSASAGSRARKTHDRRSRRANSSALRVRAVEARPAPSAPPPDLRA